MYFILEIPALDFCFAIRVGEGVDRMFSCLWILEMGEDFWYYMSWEPLQQVSHRNYRYIWAMFRGDWGIHLTWRGDGLWMAGRGSRGRIARMMAGKFQHIRETLGPSD